MAENVPAVQTGTQGAGGSAPAGAGQASVPATLPPAPQAAALTQAQPPAQPAASAAPQFVTAEQFKQGLDQFSANLGQQMQDWVQRGIQSQLDRRQSEYARNLQQAQAQAQVAAAAAKVIGMDDAQAELLQQQMVNDARASFLQGTAQGQKRDQGQRRAAPTAQQLDYGGDTDSGDDADLEYLESPQAEIDYVNAEAYEVFQRFGLQQGDPELAQIKANGTAEDYINSVWQAGMAKWQRQLLDQVKQQFAGQAPLNPAAMPALGVGGVPAPNNPLANVNTVSEAREIANAQIRQQRAQVLRK